ncbi:MAG: hypothetical protein A2498_06390 [Lentisphaerae bacterium RIFOXYC12_FULL_60_16]|nr:MAG: hypothetical protein A2498_06390 [Lentisphaerae bacterium RIFOXYC12_FULL_60_16]
MPISDIQADVLKLIAVHRSPESYLAGATVIHRDANTPRFSQDLDFFHDLADSIAKSAEMDSATLRQAGYEVAWLLRTPTFHRAVVTMGKHQLKIEWAQDSAFRFFPVQKDERFGYRLHEADAAINKILALAGRDEIRDFVDVLHLHETYLSLGAMAWAACGKDPGFTPEFLLDHAGRHTAYTQADLNRLSLRLPLDLKTLKQSWLKALNEARTLIAMLPPDEIGCLYLGPNQKPMTPDTATDSFRTLTRHTGSIRGAWPTVTIPPP